MTWCSEVSTSSGLRLASSAIHRRFVDRFAGLMSLPVFPVDGSLSTAPPFPTSGPGEPSSPLSAVLRRRYDFPFAHQQSLIGSLPPPTRSSFGSCSLKRAPGRTEVSSRPGPLFVPATPISGSLARGREWDLSGLQAIHPVPLLRSRTPVEPMHPRLTGCIDAAPAIRTAKASAMADFGAN